MKSIILIFVFITSVYFLHSQSIIINHNDSDLPQVPEEWIIAAKQNLRIAYGHTSHGSQLVSGIDAVSRYFRDFAEMKDIYSFEKSSSGYQEGLFLNDYGIPGASDLGHNGNLQWKTATENLLNRQGGCDRNVIIWSWCGGCSDNTADGIDAYLEGMTELENKFPDVTFIYMTGHLDGTGEEGNLNYINNRIRDYCTENSKILFDFADIESYAPGGNVNFMEMNCNDACQYDSDANGTLDKNWADEWIAANPEHLYTAIAEKSYSCAHSKALNCVKKGAAFWNMMAQIAGWQQETKTEETKLMSESYLSTMPNPAAEVLHVSCFADRSGLCRFQIFDAVTTNPILEKDVFLSAGQNSFTIKINELPVGVYFLRGSSNRHNCKKYINKFAVHK